MAIGSSSFHKICLRTFWCFQCRKVEKSQTKLNIHKMNPWQVTTYIFCRYHANRIPQSCKMLMFLCLIKMQKQSSDATKFIRTTHYAGCVTQHYSPVFFFVFFVVFLEKHKNLTRLIGASLYMHMECRAVFYPGTYFNIHRTSIRLRRKMPTKGF